MPVLFVLHLDAMIKQQSTFTSNTFFRLSSELGKHPTHFTLYYKSITSIMNVKQEDPKKKIEGDKLITSIKINVGTRIFEYIYIHPKNYTDLVEHIFRVKNGLKKLLKKIKGEGNSSDINKKEYVKLQNLIGNL